MTLCDFCQKTLLERPQWLPGEFVKHHDSFAQWKESVREACIICTLLLEHVHAAERRVVETKEGWTQMKEDRKRDRSVRDFKVEDSLLEWTPKQSNGTKFQLPLYEAVYRDGGAGNAWTLHFTGVDQREVFGIDLLIVPEQKFAVYESSYDEPSPITIAPKSNTKSDTTLTQIQQWLSNCENHKHCQYLHRERSDMYVPTRLLDVGTLKSPKLKLVETKAPGFKGPCRYVTLSYKWGYDAPCLLMDENYKDYCKEIDERTIPGFPTTFSDAADMTRRLNIKYLWIDALCMLQKNTAEWLKEAPKMQEIYTNAYVNLAAVSADNCDQGLYRERDPKMVRPCVVKVAWGGHQPPLSCFIIRDDLWSGEILSEPLYTRGWVLQERLLAARLLQFHRRQVFWSCPSLTACESHPGGLSTVVDDERRDEMQWRRLFHRDPSLSLTWQETAKLHALWQILVQNYTTCNLTKSRDKLMAISGIAKQMAIAFNEPYIAGMWKHDLVEQLAWRVFKFRPPVFDQRFRAPSWAWPAVDGVVKLPARLRQNRDYIMKIFEQKGTDSGINLVLENPNEKFASLLFASLTVETELHRLLFEASEPAKSSSSRSWTWHTGDGVGQGAWCRFYPDVEYSSKDLNVAKAGEAAQGNDIFLEEMLSNDTTPRNIARTTFTAAMLLYDGASTESYSGFALALRPLRSDDTQLFTRVGIVEFRNLTPTTWEAFQAVRQPKPKDPGQDIAASDDRSAFTHVITLL